MITMMLLSFQPKTNVLMSGMHLGGRLRGNKVTCRNSMKTLGKIRA